VRRRQRIPPERGQEGDLAAFGLPGAAGGAVAAGRRGGDDDPLIAGL
jgi:hypothetical protein